MLGFFEDWPLQRSNNAAFALGGLTIVAAGGLALLAGQDMTVTVLVAAASLASLLGIWHVTGRRLAAALSRLAADAHETGALAAERKDVIGQIATAIVRLRDEAAAQKRLREQQGQEYGAITAALATGLEALRSGDLATSVSAAVPPEQEALKTAFNEAVVRLRELIAAVNRTAGGITLRSDEIARAAEDLARRTESSAASLEQSSAALVTIDDRLRMAAQLATGTANRANEAVTGVKQGVDLAHGAVDAMGRVQESAKGIASVIGGLDKIAFQTRVLAMNAAIEASRAGDAGRGFSVVADLVNSLAMRAEEEAKRARDQLAAARSDIDIAVEAVHLVDGTFNGISDEMSEVHSLLERMATDHKTQSAVISEISNAIRTMEQVTQQNAATAEQAAAASRNLHGEVAALGDQVSRFRTGAPVSRASAGARLVTRMPESPAAPAPATTVARTEPRAMAEPARAPVEAPASAAAKPASAKAVIMPIRPKAAPVVPEKTVQLPVRTVPSPVKTVSPPANVNDVPASAVGDDDWRNF
ncbi:methyl-accepting chemotaxis protein [Iodidimonas sp. SYSU 1G8]|uniref:methyl-accepting chemotaxis protein n=1 Tax=Iodidimonas sp. SYSU 1G8 TaxID=3133967 RepID=UPI0031FE7FB9